MSSKLRNILLIINALALGASILWAITAPGFEPIITLLTLIATLFGLLITKTGGIKIFKQNQKGAKYSKNYQAGHDINIDK